MNRRYLLLLITVLVFSIAITSCGSSAVAELPTNSATTSKDITPSQSVSSVSPETTATNINDETIVAVDGDNITVGGTSISTDLADSIYLAKKVETHPEVTKEVENRVITVTQPGKYRFSGKGENLQILVAIDESLQEKTYIILDNLEISCDTAPAILVLSGYETKEAGTGSVVLELAENSNNIITGSHTSKDEANGIAKKNDGGISSNVSLIVDGSGALTLNADKEGIESKMHLTINNGNLEILAHDDAINASEDGVSEIIINGGHIVANSTFGAEGDGIDSNGSLTINGGTVFAFGNENSMDSGLDSDLGITINGGTVLATGNMYDEIKASDSQDFVFLQPASKSKERLTLVDQDGTAIFSYLPEYSFTNLCFSSSALKSSSYTVYRGGNVVGDQDNGLTLMPTSFSDGTEIEPTVIPNVGDSGRGGGGRGGGQPPPNAGR